MFNVLMLLCCCIIDHSHEGAREERRRRGGSRKKVEGVEAFSIWICHKNALKITVFVTHFYVQARMTLFAKYGQEYMVQ